MEKENILRWKLDERVLDFSITNLHIKAELGSLVKIKSNKSPSAFEFTSKEGLPYI